MSNADQAIKSAENEGLSTPSGEIKIWWWCQACGMACTSKYTGCSIKLSPVFTLNLCDRDFEKLKKAIEGLPI